MAKKTEQKEVSLGTCRFCQQEFAKSKMTQHLKTCKARAAELAQAEGEGQRLFHLLVEGKYRPEYWMHLEVRASTTLGDLDDFLRAIWLECCDHLSEFRIDGASYSAMPDDEWDMDFGAAGGLRLVDNEEVDEDEEDVEGDEEQLPGMEEMASEISKQLSIEFQADLKDVPLAEIEKKLMQMFEENMPPGMAATTMPALRPMLGFMASSLQQGTLAQELEEIGDEDESELDTELGDVLNVGTKFSYVYDFGSSSTLALRVISEREGVLLDDEEDESEDVDGETLAANNGKLDEDGQELLAIDFDEEEVALIVMARNLPPALKCHICGQPATHVPSSSEYASPAEDALCTTHAGQSEYPDELLPIVNSPRVGICGYTGDEEDDWVEWEEEEDEDETEE